MSKTKFKLPRKTKKALKKGMWLYPADEKGNSLMASPSRNEKDYVAYKKGKLRKIGFTNKNKRQEYHQQLNKEVSITDETLRSYVNDIFHKDHRQSSYDTLRAAKKKKGSIKAYYNFVNAYHMYKGGDDSYSNICCMSVDLARELLKNHKKK